jgi:hypothetical protein
LASTCDASAGEATAERYGAGVVEQEKSSTWRSEMTLMTSSDKNSPNPDVVPRDVPDEIERREKLPEGPVPGLPVATDPLLQPMPRPAPREVPPSD